jgi:Rrf2 family transcriptional regulator, iron-sulfur cluster assembly transcription factor
MTGLQSSIFSICNSAEFEFYFLHPAPTLESAGTFKCPQMSMQTLKERIMRLSTRGRFAVAAMIDVALREHRGPVSLAAVSARQQISLSYLEQLFAQLRRAGLVDSTRGPDGGYTLGQRSEQISVADIIATVDPSTGDDEPGASIAKTGDDMARELWDRLNAVMLDQMRSISLRQLVEQQRARGLPEAEEQAPVRHNKGISARPNPVTPALRPSVPNSVFALAASLGVTRRRTA